MGALLSNSPIDLPWWRVVRSDGRLATPPTAGQAALLRAEGVDRPRRPRGRVAGRPVPPVTRSAVTAYVRRRPCAGDTERAAVSACAVPATLALDLDERHADVGQGVAHRGGVRAEAVAEALDEAADGVDRQRGRARSGGSDDRWMAASSYRPITWLVTTTSAGASATRRRAASIAASASLRASSAAGVVRRRRDQRRRIRRSRLLP